VQNVAMSDLKLGTAPVAHLTGTFHYAPTDPEIKALREYVESGGTLLIDTCGGGADFNDSVLRTVIPNAFPDARPRALMGSHPLLSSGPPGMDDLTGRPTLRPFALVKLGASGGSMQIFTSGKGHVIYTPLDVVSGLLGTKTWSILGFDSKYAESFTKNLILWTANGAKD